VKKMSKIDLTIVVLVLIAIIVSSSTLVYTNTVMSNMSILISDISTLTTSVENLTALNEKLNSLLANYTESQSGEESTPEDLQQLVETIKNELTKGLTDEELKELVIRLEITCEDLDQLRRELTWEEYDELLWGMKWAQQPAPEYTKHREDDPEKYDVQGLRVNADFKIDLHSWYPTIEPGTYWVPAARFLPQYWELRIIQ